MSAMGQPANAVAQVQHTRPVQGTEQFELDVVGRHALEQPTALPEQHGHQLQLHLVQQAGTKALLRGRGAVQQDVAATGRGLGLRDAGFDAVGDVARMSRRGLVGCGMGQHEDRDPVVVIACPAAREVEGTPTGDHRSRGHQLVEHGRAGPVDGPVRTRIHAASAQPVVQPLSVDAESMIHSVVRAGDEPVHRHRHVEHDLAHRPSVLRLRRTG
jgi:hypothetical protein